MIPSLFFYQLAILGLLWLCVLLHAAWPSQCVAAQGTPVKPIKPRRQRSKEPTPFAGLTHKPHCVLCEHEATHPKPPPPVPPAPVIVTRRRPRQVNTSMHFCPHLGCDYRGWLGRGNLRANGHPSGGPWRQLHCTGCDGNFLETHGTLFHGKRVAVDLLVRVIACLAEGLGIGATARVFEVDLNTVLQWLVEAAEQLQAFSAYFLCNLHIKQLQLDELYAVLRDRKAGEISDAEAITRLERSPHWVWTAMDPESKLLRVMDIGTRTLAMAQRVVHHVAGMLAPACVPLCVTDDLKDYGTALLTHFGSWMQPERRQAKGPRPTPHWMPLPALLYAHVVKSSRHRRLIGVQHRVVFGTMAQMQQVLLAGGRKINTAFVERLNLNLRQRVAAVGRRVNTLYQGEDGLQPQLAVFHAYHNFVLPHASLRLALGELVPSKGTGSVTWWRPHTPAMAAGVANHVWTLHEVLLVRVPPWLQPCAG